jgi:hypothetical protein
MLIADGPHRITEAVHERLDGQVTIPQSHSNRNVLNGKSTHHKLPEGIVVRVVRSTCQKYIGVRKSLQEGIRKNFPFCRTQQKG